MLRFSAFSAVSAFCVFAFSGCDGGGANDDCAGHDGGDGSCVDVGACSDGFFVEAGGRCSRWVELAPVPFAAQRGQALRIADGRVVIFGGTDGSQHDEVALYDPDTRTWTSGAPMRQPRSFHLAIELDDRRIIVAGGEFNSQALSSSEFYDPERDEWTPGPTLRTPFAFGQIFLDGARHPRILTGQRVGDEVLIDDEWQLVPGPSLPRVAGNFHVVGDHGVLVGGFQDSQTVDSVERYDLQEDRWTVLGSNPVFERVQFTSGVLGNGSIVTVAGSDGQRVVGTTGFVDNDGRLRRGADAVTPHQFATAASLSDGTVLCVGGITGVDETAAVLSDARLFTADGSLLDLPALPENVVLAYVVELEDGDVLVAQGSNIDRAFDSSFLLERGPL